MSASWPAAKKTFTAIVDGTTKLEAANVNTVYDEVEAMQTFIGSPGTTQAKNAALNRLFKYMGAPLPKVTWIDADTIEIAACCVAMFDGSDHVFKERTSALQITVSGNLDTGSEASDTWYEVFLVGDGADSQYTAQFVVQGGAPDGATYYKKIFAVRNNGSGDIIPFIHKGNKVIYANPLTDTQALNNGASASYADITLLPNFVPAIAELCSFIANTSAGNTLFLRPNGWSTDFTRVYSTSVMYLPIPDLPFDSDQLMEYKVDGGSPSMDLYVQDYTIRLT